MSAPGQRPLWHQLTLASFKFQSYTVFKIEIGVTTSLIAIFFFFSPGFLS